MESAVFVSLRKRLGATQRQMCQILGVSLRAVHAYEQGWRRIPPHVERQLLFLLAWRKGFGQQDTCWKVRACPRERRETCPAWQLQLGHLCWFVNGSICEGKAQKNWHEKMALCWECEIVKRLLEDGGRAPRPAAVGPGGPKWAPASLRCAKRLPSRSKRRRR